NCGRGGRRSKAMNFADVEAVANAVLFEGYILYPYRPMAIKNRQRWNFGTLYPASFAARLQPPERAGFAAEVLVECDAGASITAQVRFLQLVASAEREADWKEGFARARTVGDVEVGELCAGIEYSLDFSEAGEEERASVPAGMVTRGLLGKLTFSTARMVDGLYKLQASFRNVSPTSGEEKSREAVEELAFTSAHLLLAVGGGGRFVSLLDPPTERQAAAKGCKQDGVYPVLLGKDGDRSRMLCSPIILYDYPKVAPESAGDFFDGTEMDEMLALRVLTLTDEEKAAMRAGDPHARTILERTEMLPPEQWMKVHGAVRGLRTVEQEEMASLPAAADPFGERPPVECVRAFGVELRKGDRVRLWPQKKADILDMAMEGRVAIIETIEQDLEDNVHLAVVIEDDPGRDMGMLRQAGHRFFYTLDEIEPLREE
ncbi:MAG: hypothetical protein WBF42_07660, partial [Terracidiphilus sp.]